MDTIAFDSTGNFEFDTEAGTTYVLALGDQEQTVTRKPGMHRPSEKEVAARKRGDFEPQLLVGRSDIALGHRASLSIAIGDDIEAHESATVIAIRRISA